MMKVTMMMTNLFIREIDIYVEKLLPHHNVCDV